MADGKLDIKWDGRALGRAVGLSPEVGEKIAEMTEQITARANSLGGSFSTGRWHDPETGEGRGPSNAAYEGDVERGKNAYVGIVHPANYAAMKDNMLNNTLLKSM